MKKLIVLLSAMVLLLCFSCSTGNPAASCEATENETVLCQNAVGMCNDAFEYDIKPLVLSGQYTFSDASVDYPKMINAYGSPITLNGYFDFATSSDGETQTLKMNLIYTTGSGSYRVEANLSAEYDEDCGFDYSTLADEAVYRINGKAVTCHFVWM